MCNNGDTVKSKKKKNIKLNVIRNNVYTKHNNIRSEKIKYVL